MKRFHFLWTALATVAFIACTAVNKEEPEIINPGQEEVVPEGYEILTIEASRVDDTKTAYANEVTFSWSAGDQISVLCNNGTNNFWQTFTVDTPSASSTFTAQAPVGTKIGSLDENPVKIALYPADANHVYTGATEISFHIPAVRDFRSANGGHKETAIPMFAWGDTNDCFAFANLTGAAKFTFVNIPSNTTQVKFLFENTCDLKLNGTFPLSIATSAADVAWSAVETQEPSESAVTYYADVENGMATFYLPYAEGALWPWNHVKLVDANNESTILYDNDKVNKIVITKNQIVKLPSLDASTGGVVNNFTPSWGPWDNIPTAINTDDTYPAIRKMKAYADDSSLYLYLEVAPSALDKTHLYDHKFRFYVADDGGSTSYWGSAKTTRIETEAWAVDHGSIAFAYWDGTPFEGYHTQAEQDTWYYEIKISRTHAKTASLLQNAGTVKIGVILDDYYYIDGDPSGHHNFQSQSGTPFGVIPNAGGEMYSVTLPGSTNPEPVTNVNLAFEQATGEVTNPERGFYSHNEFHYKKGATPTSIDNTSSDNTLVLTIIYLEDFVSSAHISSTAITKINTIFTNVRNAGKKAIVRFAYTDNQNASKRDASKSNMLNHISDVSQILSDNADVIYVVQAGFIGVWGEWYYSTYFTGSDETDYNTSGNSVTGYENRHQIIDALLAAVPSNRQVAIRTPYHKRFYLSPTNFTLWNDISSWDGTDANSRLSLHNDAFRASSNDIDTFKYSEDIPMWEAQSSHLACGGETGYVSSVPSYADVDLSLAAISSQHISYLNDNLENKIMKYWYDQGRREEIRQALGYRLWLSEASLSYSALSAGSSLSVSFKLNNSGAAPVINKRPMKLVLLHGNTPTILVDNVGEVRNVTANGGYQTFTMNFTLPTTIQSGDKLAIWLPDDATNLQSNSAYSIRLANKDDKVTWVNGYNVFYTF